MSGRTSAHALVHHLERAYEPSPVDPRLLDDLGDWDQLGTFPIVILPGGGTRIDAAAQLERYASGRTKPGPILTNARDLASTAHGHAAALDLAPAKVAGSVVLGIYTPELDGAEWASRAKALADFFRARGRGVGLDWKRAFPPTPQNPLGGDSPHVELAEAVWRAMPCPPAQAVPPIVLPYP